MANNSSLCMWSGYYVALHEYFGTKSDANKKRRVQFIYCNKKTLCNRRLNSVIEVLYTCDD